MKDPSRKQVIVPISMNNAEKVMANTDNHDKPTFKRS